MGMDPQKSVVNSFCQSHDVPNFFVIDSSCHVTEGGGAVPLSPFKLSPYAHQIILLLKPNKEISKYGIFPLTS